MTHPVAASFTRRSSEVAEWFGKNPWVGWAAWIVFCISILVQTGPKRFGSTFSVYLDYASKLWNKQPLYDATTLDGFNYWPSALLIYIPVLKLHPVVAGWIMITIAMAVFTWACVKLLEALLPHEPGQARIDRCGHLAADQHSRRLVQFQIHPGADPDDLRHDPRRRCDDARAILACLALDFPRRGGEAAGDRDAAALRRGAAAHAACRSSPR